MSEESVSVVVMCKYCDKEHACTKEEFEDKTVFYCHEYEYRGEEVKCEWSELKEVKRNSKEILEMPFIVLSNSIPKTCSECGFCFSESCGDWKNSYYEYYCQATTEMKYLGDEHKVNHRLHPFKPSWCPRVSKEDYKNAMQEQLKKYHEMADFMCESEE